jgi:glycerol-3-phosphate dehydrogenase
MGAALALNDMLSHDRNRGLPAGSRLPGGRIISKPEILRIAPGLRMEGLSGGAVWHDCLVENTERLTLAFILAADGDGACAANYVSADRLNLKDGTVTGVAATDTLSGNSFDVRARMTIDAGGPWAGAIPGSPPPGTGPRLPARWARATNLYVRKPLIKDFALGIRGKEGGQVFFLVPWRGGTMIGTWYREHRGTRECVPRKEEIPEMIDDVNRVYPPAVLSLRDVRFSHAGLVPLGTGSEGGSLHRQLEGETRVVDYSGGAGVAGLIGICGVKYTTACRVAEEAVRLAATRLQRPGAARAHGPLLGVFDGRVPTGARRAVDARTIARMAVVHGAAAGRVLDLIDEDPALGKRIPPGGDTVGAEIVHAVREEMGVSLSDVVFRRTGLGSDGNPGRPALEECAALMAAELGWSTGRMREEVAAVEERFIPYQAKTESEVSS